MFGVLPISKFWIGFFVYWGWTRRLWDVLVLWQALNKNNDNTDELVKEFNVKIEPVMVEGQGCVLDPPSVSPFPSFCG